MAQAVEYAGHVITLDEMVEARAAIEDMAVAHKEGVFKNDIHFAGHSTTMDAVRDVCMLASAMWYRLSQEQDAR